MRRTLALALVDRRSCSAASPAARGPAGSAPAQSLTRTVYVSATDRQRRVRPRSGRARFRRQGRGQGARGGAGGPGHPPDEDCDPDRRQRHRHLPLRRRAIHSSGCTGGPSSRSAPSPASTSSSSTTRRTAKCWATRSRSWWRGRGRPTAGNCSRGFSRPPRISSGARPIAPVIVVLTVGGEEHSPLPAHHVLDQLRKSGAALHVVSVSSSALRSMAAVRQAVGAARREPESQRGARRRTETVGRATGTRSSPRRGWSPGFSSSPKRC